MSSIHKDIKVFEETKYESKLKRSKENLNKTNVNIQNLMNMDNYKNGTDLSQIESYFEMEKIIEIKNIILNNKGFNYLLIFNLFFFPFIISICRISIMDPGKIEKEYKELYDLERNFQNYFKFCKKYSSIKNQLLIDTLNKNKIKNESDKVNINSQNILMQNFKLFLNSKLKELKKCKFKQYEKRNIYSYLEIDNIFNNN